MYAAKNIEYLISNKKYDAFNNDLKKKNSGTKELNHKMNRSIEYHNERNYQAVTNYLDRYNHMIDYYEDWDVIRKERAYDNERYFDVNKYSLRIPRKNASVIRHLKVNRIIPLPKKMQDEFDEYYEKRIPDDLKLDSAENGFLLESDKIESSFSNSPHIYSEYHNHVVKSHYNNNVNNMLPKITSEKNRDFYEKEIERTP